MLNIVPYPSIETKENEGFFSIPEKLKIDRGSFAAWCIHAFQERMDGVEEGTDADVVLTKREELGKETYELLVTKDRIEIEAGEETGVIWALTTVVALMKKDGIPCCRIADAPKYHHRGVLFDCARHFFSPEEVKRVIEGMSLVKMNVLHWHLSDDQAWRIESEKFPHLQQEGMEYYTRQEIREIVAFARERGVEILPEIDMPGHMLGLLSGYPQYSCSGKKVTPAKSGGIFPEILCPGKEETFDFLEELLEETTELFPGKRFHVGGDEAPKTEWEKCPHCRRRMEEQGLTEWEDLQGYFTGRIREILERQGKQIICWNESLLAANAPKDMQVQYWTLLHRSAMEPFIAQGGQWIYSDMFEFYFDYPSSMSSLKKAYTTKPHLGDRICGREEGMLGMECCLWTEHVTEGKQAEQQLFPRILAVAEQSWIGQRAYAEFENRVSSMKEGYLGRTVTFAPKEDWNPTGKRRRESTLAYFKKMTGAMTPEVRQQTVSSTKPSMEFAQSFLKQFFKKSDLLFLPFVLLKK